MGQEERILFSKDRLLQRMTKIGTEHRVELWFSKATEAKNQIYRILCSSDLIYWDDCTDQFRLTEQTVNSMEVPPTVTSKWISKVDQSSHKFFRIELRP